jgi:hypothetical protein
MCFNVNFGLLKTIYVHLLVCYFNKPTNVFTCIVARTYIVSFKGNVVGVIFGSYGGDLFNLLSHFIVNKNCDVAELIQ